MYDIPNIPNREPNKNDYKKAVDIFYNIIKNELEFYNRQNWLVAVEEKQKILLEKAIKYYEFSLKQK